MNTREDLVRLMGEPVQLGLDACATVQALSDRLTLLANVRALWWLTHPELWPPDAHAE